MALSNNDDLDTGISYRASTPNLQKLLDKVKARKRAAGEGTSDRNGMIMNYRALSSKLDDLIEFQRGYQATKAGFGPMTSDMFKRWTRSGVVEVPKRKGIDQRLLAGALRNRRHSMAIENIPVPESHRIGAHMRNVDEDRIRKLLDPMGQYSSKLDDLIELDIYLPHGFQKTLPAKGEPGYESWDDKLRRELELKRARALAQSKTLDPKKRIRIQLSDNALRRTNDRVDWENATAREITKHLKSTGQLSSKMDALIQFADPRPRNNLGEFSPQNEGGPDPNAMVKTYRIAPNQPGMAPNKNQGPGLAGIAGLGLVGGAAGATGAEAAKGAGRGLHALARKLGYIKK